MTPSPSARLALFVPSLRGGGAERVIVNLATVFAEHGHPVDLVLCRKDGAFAESLAPGIRVVDLQASGVMAAVPRLAAYLRRVRPVALLSAMDHANVAAVLAGALARQRTRVVVSAHVAFGALSRAEGSWRLRWLARLLPVAYRHAEAIVCVSEGVAAELSALTSISRTAMTVIHNPVVTSGLLLAAAAPVDHPWFTDREVATILAVGRLEPQKDIGTLIDAFALLHRDRRVRLAILGTGSQHAALQAAVTRSGLDADVWFGGFQHNPFAYMKRASVLALSSIYEGFGNVLVEAMACGTPVVSTDCPSGPSEILAGGRFGRLVPPRSPADLAEAIAATLDHPAEPALLRQRAADFTAEAAAARYLSLLLRAE